MLHDGDLICTGCGARANAEQVLYGSHECDPAAAAAFALSELAAALDDGSLQRLAERWVEGNRRAAQQRAFSAYLRSAEAA